MTKIEMLMRKVMGKGRFFKSNGCSGCKYLGYWSNRKAMCLKGCEKECVADNFSMKEITDIKPHEKR